jgi:phosphatidylinositol-3-phosphatase
MRGRILTISISAVMLIGAFVYGVASSPARSPIPSAAKAKPNPCGRAHQTCTPTPTTTTSTSTTSVSSTATQPPPTVHKVMVIIEENHSQTEAISSMPHLASWAASFGKATAFTAVTHPSLPNYLAIAGGSTFGVADDSSPSSHPISGDSVFDQTVSRGLRARTYAEGMTSNCMVSNTGRYAVKHNPWAYFNGTTQRANCNANDVPLGTTSAGNLLNDINSGNLPNTGMMIPDLCNDAHDCALSTADNWLAGWVPKLMGGSDYTSGNLTIVITFDEDDSSAGNNIAFVVIDPRLKSKVVSSAATHYSLTRWLDANVGAPLLRNAATAPDLKTAFGI